MNILKSQTFRAEATVGLKRGYSNQLITLDEFKMKLAGAQKVIFSEMDIKLSTKISTCTIVFSGQDEDSISLSFIQYPKFPYEIGVLKNAIIRFIEILMQNLDQNRVVIVFDDETVMLEENEELTDPRISFDNL